MSVAEMRSKIKAGIWQAVAQSGVDLSGTPEAEMDKLVGAITERMLVEFDAALTEGTGRPASQVSPAADEIDEDDEVILWEGRPYLSLSVQYQITSERLRIIEGLLAKERRDIELVRVQDIDHKQNLTERTLNIGDIFIRSHDRQDPEVTLNNVKDPEEVHEILRRAVLKARKKYNVGFREEM